MNPRLPPKWFPIGGDIHEMMRPRRQYSAEEKAEFWAYYEAVSPAPWRFMQLSWCQEAKQRCPESWVAFRPYSEDENDRINDPHRYFENNIRATDGGIILNVCNEPFGNYNPNDPDYLKRFAENLSIIMDLFGKAGRSIVAPNWGAGHPQLQYLEHFEAVWDAFRRWHDLHIVGMHPYWGHEGLNPNDGRLMRWQPVMQAIHDPKVLFWFTEWGADDLLDGTGLRGWKHYLTEGQYADQWEAVIMTHHRHPQIIGASPYCHGNTGEPTEPPGQGQDWDTHDWSKAFFLKSRIMAFAKEWRKMTEPTPTPTKPVVPKPGRYVIQSTTQGMHVRQGAGEDQTVLTTLRQDAKLTVLPSEPVQVGNYDWFHLQTVVLETVDDGNNVPNTQFKNYDGWSAATHFTKLAPDIGAPPTEPTPPAPTLSLDETDIVQSLTALLDKFKVLDSLHVDDWTDWQLHTRALKNLIYKRPTIRQLNVLTAQPVAAAADTAPTDEK